ncbi:MAG: hypothetical protein KDK37_16330, partial [Leptospiraceae bacterium]|nr:hypothetical protein [Leptospiraceae bacterium]
MKELVRSILNDSRAGLQQDASGRRYFRQRRVRFQTIEFNARGMLEGDWLQFQEELESPFRLSRDPAPSQIREFAIASSERFLTFYYKVFDVAVARALATLDQNFFQVPFIRASTYLDLGIPEDLHESSVHPSLHQTILAQYHKSKEWQAGPHHVHFLSDYLVGLTDDAIELLRPYQELWKREARIEQIHERLRLFKAELSSALFPEGMEVFTRRTADALQAQLSAIPLPDLLQKISDPATRKAIRPFLENRHKDAFGTLSRDSHILSLLNSGLSSDIARLQLPDQMDRTVRSAFLHESRWHS